MKKIIKSRLAFLLLAALAFSACNKTDTYNNNPPIANAGKDTVIFYPANSFILDGSASSDRERNIAYYSWSGPSNVTITKPGEAKTMVENLVKGINQFILTVLDKGSRSSSASVQVTVWDPQYLKSKNVKDTTIYLPYNRTILKTVDGNIYNCIYTWKKISGPSSPDIQALSSDNTGVSNLVEGVYKFELTAPYWNGFTDKDTMTVTVLPDNNIYNSEKLLESLVWVDKYPISTITINNISTILATGQQFKVYLKKDIAADWQIVCNEMNDPYNLYSYHYSIDNNVLKVSTNYDPTGWGSEDFGKYHLQPAIKIVY